MCFCIVRNLELRKINPRRDFKCQLSMLRETTSCTMVYKNPYLTIFSLESFERWRKFLFISLGAVTTSNLLLLLVSLDKNPDLPHLQNASGDCESLSYISYGSDLLVLLISLRSPCSTAIRSASFAFLPLHQEMGTTAKSTKSLAFFFSHSCHVRLSFHALNFHYYCRSFSSSNSRRDNVESPN